MRRFQFISNYLQLISELGNESLDEHNEEEVEDIDAQTFFDAGSVEETKELGEAIGIDWESVDFTPEDLLEGIGIELEHGTRDAQTNVTDNDLEDTAKIALVHFKESATYYKDLKEYVEK